ncbi:MAG: nucleotide exchange factor GrpE [Proteobacteria bacterium]|nr:nucleotide exchange factor GrpE [Pseudomonadota bacterium]
MLWKPESDETVEKQVPDETVPMNQLTDEPLPTELAPDEPIPQEQVSADSIPSEQVVEPMVEKRVSDEPIAMEQATKEIVTEERVSAKPTLVEYAPDEPALAEQTIEEPVPPEQVSDELTAQEWIAEVVTLTVEGRNQMDRIETRLDALISWPEQLERRLVEARAETVTLREEMQDLRQEMKRVGRHQFKSNTLDEARLERWQEVVKALESTLARREGEVASIHLQQRQAIESARQEWLTMLLPLLDGLEGAFVSGETQIAWLKGKRIAWEMEQTQRQGMLDRLRRVWRSGGPASDQESLTALSAWLEGLRLLRDRAWMLLQDAGVQVIPTVGQPFDPHLHVAVDAVERKDVPHSSIMSEQRRGYRLNDNVLRFAEVIVARRPVVSEIVDHQDAQPEILDT